MSMRLSNSKISSYNMCPKQYYFRYVARVPQKEMSQLILGMNLHEKYEKFFNALPEKIESQEQIQDTFEKICKPTDVAKETPHLMNFLDMNLKAFGDLKEKDLLKHFKPIAVEKKYYDEELDFVGVIDAVFKLDDKILVIDWKSSYYKDGKESYYRCQLAGYKFLWDKKNPDKKITHWGIGFSGNNVLWTEPYKEISMTSMFKKLEKTRNDIKEGKFEKKKNSPCQWCSYYERCWEDI